MKILLGKLLNVMVVNGQMPKKNRHFDIVYMVCVRYHMDFSKFKETMREYYRM